jgi:hypothetical protein
MACKEAYSEDADGVTLEWLVFLGYRNDGDFKTIKIGSRNMISVDGSNVNVNGMKKFFLSFLVPSLLPCFFSLLPSLISSLFSLFKTIKIGSRNMISVDVKENIFLLSRSPSPVSSPFSLPFSLLVSLIPSPFSLLPPSPFPQPYTP